MKYLEERGAACIVCADNETEEQIRLKEGGDTYRSDCMIVLGGDGTMLKAARETAASGIPLLGVNLGTVGYLAEVEPLALDLALEKLLREEEIDDRFVFCHPGTRQVPGCIIIDDEGNNMIILGSGTQQALLHEEVDLALESMQSARYCVTGYELDVKSVEYLVRKARMLGIQTILNPSPVPNQKPGFWDCVDILVLNEVEAAHMLRLADGQPTEQWEETARKLRAAYGCRQVVVTLGPQWLLLLGRK